MTSARLEPLMRLFLGLLLFVAACHGHGSGKEPDEFTGCATDENWVTFDDEEPLASVGNTNAPTITAPQAGTLPAAPKPVFRWTLSSTEAGTPAGDVPQSCES